MVLFSKGRLGMRDRHRNSFQQSIAEDTRHECQMRQKKTTTLYSNTAMRAPCRPLCCTRKYRRQRHLSERRDPCARASCIVLEMRLGHRDTIVILYGVGLIERGEIDSLVQRLGALFLRLH